jgi:hypothetical protein
MKKKFQTNLQKLHVYEKYGEAIIRMQFVGFFLCERWERC